MAPSLGDGDRWFDPSRADTWFDLLMLTKHGALAERQLHSAVDRTPRAGYRGSSPLRSTEEEWPSGLRQRTANPSWAAPPTARSNRASSAYRQLAGGRFLLLPAFKTWHCSRVVSGVGLQTRLRQFDSVQCLMALLVATVQQGITWYATIGSLPANHPLSQLSLVVAQGGHVAARDRGSLGEGSTPSVTFLAV